MASIGLVGDDDAPLVVFGAPIFKLLTCIRVINVVQGKLLISPPCSSPVINDNCCFCGGCAAVNSVAVNSLNGKDIRLVVGALWETSMFAAKSMLHSCNHSFSGFRRRIRSRPYILILVNNHGIGGNEINDHNNKFLIRQIELLSDFLSDLLYCISPSVNR